MSLPVLVVITACAEVPALVMFAVMSPVAISALMTVTSAIPKLTSADPLTMTASAVVVPIVTSLPSAVIVTVEPLKVLIKLSVVVDEVVSLTSPSADCTVKMSNEPASTSTSPRPKVSTKRASTSPPAVIDRSPSSLVISVTAPAPSLISLVATKVTVPSLAAVTPSAPVTSMLSPAMSTLPSVEVAEVSVTAPKPVTSRAPSAVETAPASMAPSAPKETVPVPVVVTLSASISLPASTKISPPAAVRDPLVTLLAVAIKVISTDWFPASLIKLPTSTVVPPVIDTNESLAASKTRDTSAAPFASTTSDDATSLSGSVPA